MEIISKQGDPKLAEVYVAKFRNKDKYIAEFVDARDPDRPTDYKWVIIISTQYGCPISCPMCDAGGNYYGNLTEREMLSQIDHVVNAHPTSRLRSVLKFKVQFARMGEPALNPAVLDTLVSLPCRYNAPGLIPCISTTAPRKSMDWLWKLLDIRHCIYEDYDFQLQLSINSTDEATRDMMVPTDKLTLSELGEFASRFHVDGKRKVALNFAITENVPVDPAIIAKHFDPNHCMVKLTPLNPTVRSQQNGLNTALPPDSPEVSDKLCAKLSKLGFDVVLSIGDTRENEIGSNCGMTVHKMITDLDRSKLLPAESFSKESEPIDFTK
jgi:23S rRNA (adenine2503-C2)-methyltransferase